MKKQAGNSRTNNTPVGTSDEEHPSAFSAYSHNKHSPSLLFGTAAEQQIRISPPYTTSSTRVKGPNAGKSTRKRGSGASNYGNGGGVRAKRYTN